MSQTPPDPDHVPPGESNDIVVFLVRRATKCVECGRELFDGNQLRLEDARPLCLDCETLGIWIKLAIGQRRSSYSAQGMNPRRNSR